MAFIRNKSEERTGYQNGGPLQDKIDNQCDYVLVYRLDETFPERIKQYKDKGYTVHFMTGISWGSYLDYLSGSYDGQEHWDEAQQDRYGNIIAHGVDVPYMVPTIAFSDYLSLKLRKVIDCGVEAIHVEEPEFWDRAGYSPAFKREYEVYYREPWKAPHESVDGQYKCARLKAYLYTRTIDRLSASLKAYAKSKYNQDLRFYVPTHSLLNYTQWKIVSPEGKLADIPGVDGCIAQVWTGTSREKNWFDGKYEERTFETAYLEYGVMQELVKGTGRHMWFLHDPIEDNPIYDWDDYRKNYYYTVVASLLHPKVNTYEICPWPSRVFYEKYPRNSENARYISESYATELNNMFNTLGNIECPETEEPAIGILMADSQLCQREYPDNLFTDKKAEETGTVLRESDELVKRFKTELFASETPDRELMLKFMTGNAFPGFYGLALPLLKYGIPVRPVLLDNTRRYPGYLSDYKVLIMSYEFMKPEYPDMNNSLAEWVKQGGTLIYVGNGFDPFRDVSSWWSGKYDAPAEHLYEMLGVEPKGNEDIIPCGKGVFAFLNRNPSEFCFSKENADIFRKFTEKVLSEIGMELKYGNELSIRREPYVISAVMKESITEKPVVYNGLFADMTEPDFEIITEKQVNPGETAILCDLSKIDDELCVIGTSCRINTLEFKNGIISLEAYGADDLKANIRLRVPYEPKKISSDCCAVFEYEAKSKTVLIKYNSKAKPVKITLE